jgi:multiple antibiotic resistance protein
VPSGPKAAICAFIGVDAYSKESEAYQTVSVVLNSISGQKRSTILISERLLYGMDQDFFRFGLAALVTLLVVVDPPGVVPIFVALTKNEPPARRQAILVRSVLIAFGVALFFLLYLGVTVHAFSISGGILLFVAAMPMLFGQRGGLQAPEPEEQGSVGPDISVFPLAMPLLSGPGAIATILLLTSQAEGDVKKLLAIGVAIAVVFLISFVSLYLGARLIRIVGEGGVHIATRVMGIVLTALAVQYVLNGITGYYNLLSVH